MKKILVSALLGAAILAFPQIAAAERCQHGSSSRTDSFDREMLGRATTTARADQPVALSTTRQPAGEKESWRDELIRKRNMQK